MAGWIELWGNGTGRDASGEQKTRREKSENSRDSEGNDGGRQVRRQSQISNEEYITHKSRFVLCFYFVDWILDLYSAYPSIHCHPCTGLLPGNNLRGARYVCGFCDTTEIGRPGNAMRGMGNGIKGLLLLVCSRSFHFIAQSFRLYCHRSPARNLNKEGPTRGRDEQDEWN